MVSLWLVPYGNSSYGCQNMAVFQPWARFWTCSAQLPWLCLTLWSFTINVHNLVQLLSLVWLFVTPWTAAHHASMFFTVSWNLLKLMSIESVMPSNSLILWCPFPSCPQSFPESGSFPMSQLFTSGGQTIGVSASVSIFPMNIQGWFPLGLTGLIFCCPKDSWESFSA